MAAVPSARSSSNVTGPQLITDPNGFFTYGLWCDLTGNLFAFRRNNFNGAIVSIDLSTVASNQLSLPLDDIADGHFNFSCMIGGDGVFHVAGNMRASTNFRYVRCTNVNAFTTVGSWTSGGDPFAALSSSADDVGAAYLMWDRLSNGDPIVYLGQCDANTGGEQDCILMKWTSGAWAAATGDGHLVTVETGTPQPAAYPVGMTVEPGAGTAGADRIHVAYMFRTTQSDPNTMGSAGYIVSNDGGSTWTNAAGTSVSIPITQANKTTSQISAAPSIVPLYHQGICVDANGRPHLALETSGDIGAANAFRRHYWDGSAWQQHATTSTQIVSFHWFKGAVWRKERTFSGTNGVQIFKLPSGPTVNLSHEVPAFYPNPDPAALRMFGRFEIIVPDGNNLQLYQFGAGHRAAAA